MNTKNKTRSNTVIFVWLVVTFSLSAMSLAFAKYAMDNVQEQKNQIKLLIEQNDSQAAGLISQAAEIKRLKSDIGTDSDQPVPRIATEYGIKNWVKRMIPLLEQDILELIRTGEGNEMDIWVSGHLLEDTPDDVNLVTLGGHYNLESFSQFQAYLEQNGFKHREYLRAFDDQIVHEFTQSKGFRPLCMG